MKKTIFSLVMMLFIWNSQSQNVASENALIIVYDVSASVGTSSADELKKFITGVYKPYTDIIVYTANESSNNASNGKVFQFLPTYKKSVGYKTDAQKKLNEMRQKTSLQNDSKRIITNVINYLTKLNQKTAPKTYLLDLLPKIIEQTKFYLKLVDIVFISDMLEDSSRLRMTTFTNKNSAESTAKKTIDKLVQDYNLSKNSFQKIGFIKVLIPKGTNQNKLVFLDYFWQATFNSLGYKKSVTWQSL